MLQSHFSASHPYGPTAWLHHEAMPLLWGPLANIFTFLVLYSYRKIWSWVHGIFFLVTTYITLYSSIVILLNTGFITSDSKTHFPWYELSVLHIHNVIGDLCLLSVTFVTVVGILTKLLNILQADSNTILLLRKIHQVSGYVILFLCKMNNYIISPAPKRLLLLVIDLVFVVLLVVWKIFFPKLEQNNILPKYQENIKMITSIRQLDFDKDYAVFANYVYDIQPLRINHPAGFQIIQAVKNREVDRYIYGSCPAEELPEVPVWSHSYKSFTLLDQPIARIDIPPTFQGLDAGEVQCKIPEVKLMCKRSHIFGMYLFKKQGDPFEFLRYRYITQIGRYFSLTLNQAVTRLYTTVNFLVDENVQFLQKRLNLKLMIRPNNQISHLNESNNRNNILSPNFNNIKQELKTQIIRREIQGERNSDIQQRQIEKQIQNYHLSVKNQSIPILFKTYPGGKFTEGLVKGPINRLSISHSKGEGLQLAHTQPGKIIMIIGGTGLYPFSDLIDLLYKQQLMIVEPSTKRQILQLSPILGTDPFNQFNFVMFAAFNNVEEIHPITFEQLLFLSFRKRIDITFKFKQKIGDQILGKSSVKFTNKRFEDLIAGQMQRSKDVSRIWICGPPKMNENVSMFLRNTYKSSDLYLLV